MTTAYFFDSSTLVKCYAKERGTAFVIGLMRPSARNFLYAARFTEVEVCAALSRRRKGLTLADSYATKAILRFRRVFDNRFFTIELNQSVIDKAVRLTGIHALRGFDAMQLASALEANQDRLARALPPIVFVCADAELNTAATVEGLTVENPNNYP